MNTFKIGLVNNVLWIQKALVRLKRLDFKLQQSHIKLEKIL